MRQKLTLFAVAVPLLLWSCAQGGNSVSEPEVASSNEDMEALINTDGVDKLTDTINAQKEDYIALLEKLVSINTISGDVEGSRAITGFLKSRLEQSGGKVELYNQPEGTYLVARFQGNGKKKVLLYDHTDTVLNDGMHYRLDKSDGVAYGQGTADSKGSVAYLVKMIEVMNQIDIKPYKELILYLDAYEEVGSEFAEALAVRLAKESDVVFQADTGRPDLGIVTKRKAMGNYTISIKGIAGHAGNGPHATASAVMEAGYILTALDKLQSPRVGDPSEYTSEALEKKGVRDHGQFLPDNVINPGSIESVNKKANVVTDDAVININVRTFEQSEFERMEKGIFSLSDNPHIKGVTVKVEGKQEYKPLAAHGDFRLLADLYKAIGKKILNKDIVEWSAGGVTPANVMAEYAPVIDAVGMDSEQLFEHSVNEKLYSNAFTDRMMLGIKFIETVDNTQLGNK